MCFSQPASLGFAMLGFGTAAVLAARQHPFRRWQLFAYFALMECIQFVAYSFVDQCDNPINKVLTLLAYAHVMYQVRLQNIPVNYYFLSPEAGVHPDVRKLVITMVVIGGTMGLLTKLPWLVWMGFPATILDPLAAALPEFHSLTTAGSPEACRFEIMCAERVCTFSTPHHIAWSVPALPPSYYLPSGFVHFFFFFFPTLIMSNNVARLTMFLALFSGPLLNQLLAMRHPASYKFTWPATWCFLSVGQCGVALALELWSIYRESQAAGKPGSAGHPAAGRKKKQVAGVALVAECRQQDELATTPAAGKSPSPVRRSKGKSA